MRSSVAPSTTGRELACGRRDRGSEASSPSVRNDVPGDRYDCFPALILVPNCRVDIRRSISADRAIHHAAHAGANTGRRHWRRRDSPLGHESRRRPVAITWRQLREGLSRRCLGHGGLGRPSGPNMLRDDRVVDESKVVDNESEMVAEGDGVPLDVGDCEPEDLHADLLGLLDGFGQVVVAAH